MKNSTTDRIVRALAKTTSRISPSLAAVLLERLFLTPRRLKLRPAEHDWMATARAIPLRFDFERMFPAYFWGESGPLVVLVHGWSGRAGQLGAFVRPLVARGYRVVAFDAPAHGGADGPRTGLPEFARALHVIERQFGPAHGIIAHSMGGAATLVALSEGLLAEKLALIATPENPGGYLHIMGQWFGFSDKARREAQARIEARFGYAMSDLRGGALASRVHQPALIVHDRRDREVGFANGEALAAALSAAQLMETSGLGHNRILSTEAVVQAVAGFLSGDEPAIDGRSPVQPVKALALKAGADGARQAAPTSHSW